MVDEELPLGKEGGRKSWYLALTAGRDLAEELGPVQGLPQGKTLLLFEDDVLALVSHLFESSLVNFDDKGRVINDHAESHEMLNRITRKQKTSRTKAKPVRRGRNGARAGTSKG
jgi:hypothetical protein